MNDSRFPRRVYQLGSEPDPRFTLANERTFLAWIRTVKGATSGHRALLPAGSCAALGGSVPDSRRWPVCVTDCQRPVVSFRGR
jgi:hypothetical protein